ncbi:hypothetical protein TYRP_021019 [Tyrophagus putrescentiae]|nr:hypothetical protein TYRP_021019 [Tyrophagus putrescentiae]
MEAYDEEYECFRRPFKRLSCRLEEVKFGGGPSRPPSNYLAQPPAHPQPQASPAESFNDDKEEFECSRRPRNFRQLSSREVDVNQQAFEDLRFQLGCLASLYENGILKQSAKDKLKTIFRVSHPEYLPQPDCPVLIRFDSEREPHFEFIFCSNQKPPGWPETNWDVEVAFFSSKIYNTLKVDINQEDAAKKVFDKGVNDGRAKTPSLPEGSPPSPSLIS